MVVLEITNLVVILTAGFECTVYADIFWELTTKPAVFGENIELTCRLPESTCCHRYTRRWLGGYGLPLLTMNGVSTSPEKFSEKLNEQNLTSILTIHNVDLSDVNILYECTYGFTKYVKMLEVKEDLFISYDPKNVTSNIEFNDSHLIVNITMRDVYPKPKCIATMKESDISNNIRLISSPDGIFFLVSIIINYIFSRRECGERFFISCYVGTKVFKDSYIITCPTEDDHDNIQSIITVVVILSLVSSICFILLFIIRRQNICTCNDENRSCSCINRSYHQPKQSNEIEISEPHVCE